MIEEYEANLRGGRSHFELADDLARDVDDSGPLGTDGPRLIHHHHEVDFFRTRRRQRWWRGR